MKRSFIMVVMLAITAFHYSCAQQGNRAKHIKEALDFARNHEETLVVVTADHETGGMVVLNGDPEEGTIETTFTTSGHTPTLIPVFAYGPGSELFTGIYENTGFKERFLKAYGMAK